MDRMEVGGSTVKVLFIAGAGWSGSTLLEQALSQIDGIASVGELYWLWKPFWPEMTCECGLPFKSCEFWQEALQDAYGSEASEVRSRVDHLGAGFARHSILPALTHATRRLRPVAALDELAALMEPLYRTASSMTGGSAIVDASKIGLWGLAVSRAETVDMRVVRLVRDPRGYAVSESRTRQRTYPLALDPQGRHPARAVITWVLTNLQADLLSRSVARHTFVLYDDLVRDPAATLERVARLIDADIEAGAVFDRNALVVRSVGHAIGGNLNRPKLGNTTIAATDPSASPGSLALRLGPLAASPVWRRYQRRAFESEQHSGCRALSHRGETSREAPRDVAAAPPPASRAVDGITDVL